MLINEIFNTKVPVKWQTFGSKNQGTFLLNGMTYVVKADEWEIDLSNNIKLDFVDVGFTAGEDEKSQSLNATQLFLAPSIIGAFLNTIKPKIKELNSTGILFGAQKRDPFFDNRMSLYEIIGDGYMKHSPYNTKYKFENVESAFILLSKITLTKQQLETIQSFISSINK